MDIRNFTCPFCNRPTTITDPNHYTSWEKIYIVESSKGDIGLLVQAITCPNQECEELWLQIQLCAAYFKQGNWLKGDIIKSWQLLPESEAKVLPDYIPAPIQEDYYEACRIRDLSPKASATLSRRCLQGMIRDFWGIKKARLKDEIDALEEKVDPDIWSSIDAVRNVGNVGAHMEKDINIIVAVESGEAKLLIELIEQLFDDWYVARESRRQRTEDLKKLVADKEAQKNENKDKLKKHVKS
jgi:hypothetical protein